MLGTDHADFMVDMVTILTGISAYGTIIDLGTELSKQLGKTRDDLPQSSWSGEAREAFDMKVTCRMEEMEKILNQMKKTKKSLSSLLEGANEQREISAGFKDIIR